MLCAQTVLPASGGGFLQHLWQNATHKHQRNPVLAGGGWGAGGVAGGAAWRPLSRNTSAFCRPLCGGCSIPLPDTSWAARTVWITLVMLLVADCAAPPSAESPEMVIRRALASASAITGAISGIISICR